MSLLKNWTITMTKKHVYKIGLSLLAMTSVAALALTGCRQGADADAASPGITDETVKVGVTTVLSGPTAAPGQCVVDGATAYFDAKNDEGGVEFADGKKRKVELVTLDDAYDPQQAKSNYDQLRDEVFIMGIGLGTPTNRAFREAAISDEVPQVLTQTGDPLFSDTDESPFQLDLTPTYVSEGRAFGELLVESGEKHDVAILAQNDDYGKDYVAGFTAAIDGADQIRIVKELSYEATDTSVDAQITELAGTDADVLFNAVAPPPLAIASLNKAQQLGWKPTWFLPSTTSAVESILVPGDAANYPAIYTAAFQKDPEDPAHADDEDVQEFLKALADYTDQPEYPVFPHCSWGYIGAAVLEQAFIGMTEPTREEFMTQLRSISGFQPPMALSGAVADTTLEDQPAISVVILEKFNGASYDPVETND